MKHLKTYESFKTNEGMIGTTLCILGVMGSLYLIKKLKRFLTKFRNYAGVFRLAPFFDAIKAIEDSQSGIEIKSEVNKKFIGGSVLVDKKDDIYVVKIMDKYGNEFDSITIDIKNETVSTEDIILIPVEKDSLDKDPKNMERIKKYEEELVNDIINIISKYSEPIK
jgi:hypothetical protein